MILTEPNRSGSSGPHEQKGSYEKWVFTFGECVINSVRLSVDYYLIDNFIETQFIDVVLVHLP